MGRSLFYLLVPFVLLPLACRTPSVSDLDADRRTEFSPGDIGTFNPAHYEGPFTVDGQFDFDATMLNKRYKNLKPSMFGSLQLKLPGGYPLISRATGKPKYIREMHYHLGDSKIGIRPIPIVDRDGTPTSLDENYPQPESKYWKNYPKTGRLADGGSVRGSELIDSLIRKDLGLEENDSNAPVFALIAYIHPELHTMEFTQLADMSFLKTENGMTHLGAYIGKGITRNSPLSYHGFKWELFEEESTGRIGYPANVYTVRPKWKGADSATFTTNLLITLRLLNELNDGPIFPRDYKFDWFRAVNLEETFAFYRAWLDPTWKRHASDAKPFLTMIKEDSSYYTYCAEHLAIVLNVALNLPQNEQGYIDVWGPSDGAKLWKLAVSRYENRERIVETEQGYMTKELGRLEGHNFPVIAKDKFSPLWKVKGITSPATHKTLNHSLAFPVQTSIDLVLNMIEQYASWPDVGPAAMTSVMMAFIPELYRRTGATIPELIAMLAPFAVKAIKHDATSYPLNKSPDPSKAYDEYLALVENGGKVSGADVPGLVQLLKDLDQVQPGFTAAVVGQIMAPLKQEQVKAWVIANSGKDLNKEAWTNYELDIAEDLKKARDMKMKLAIGASMEAVSPLGETFTMKNVGFYTPPAVMQRLVNGIHAYDKDNLEFRAVATVMSADELRKKVKPLVQYEVGQ